MSSPPPSEPPLSEPPLSEPPLSSPSIIGGRSSMPSSVPPLPEPPPVDSSITSPFTMRLNSTYCWNRVSHFFGMSSTMHAVRSLVAMSLANSSRFTLIFSAAVVLPAAM